MGKWQSRFGSELTKTAEGGGRTCCKSQLNKRMWLHTLFSPPSPHTQTQTHTLFKEGHQNCSTCVVRHVFVETGANITLKPRRRTSLLCLSNTRSDTRKRTLRQPNYTQQRISELTKIVSRLQLSSNTFIPK